MRLTKRTAIILLFAMTQVLILGSLAGLAIYLKRVDADSTANARLVIESINDSLRAQRTGSTPAGCATVSLTNPDGSPRTYDQQVQVLKALGCL